MRCNIIHKYLSAVDTLIQAEKSPRDYGTGDVLYHSEINLLEIIHQNPESNAIKLSELLGITRGAITQISNKLEEKNYIVRYLQGGNKKEKYYKLTPLGESIRKGHEQYHLTANQQICNYLKSLSETEVAIIASFIEELTHLPISEFECQSHCEFRKE